MVWKYPSVYLYMTNKKINFNDRFASRQDVQSNLTLEHSSFSRSHGYKVTYTTLVTGFKYQNVLVHTALHTSFSWVVSIDGTWDKKKILDELYEFSRENWKVIVSLQYFFKSNFRFERNLTAFRSEESEIIVNENSLDRSENLRRKSEKVSVIADDVGPSRTNEHKGLMICQHNSKAISQREQRNELIRIHHILSWLCNLPNVI